MDCACGVPGGRPLPEGRREPKQLGRNLMDEPVIPFELTRIFIGDHSPLFLLEVAARTLLIYAYTFALVRWIGGRSVAQLSVVEFVLVIALGSAVGDPMFYPDVPLLPAMAVIAVVVFINKGLDLLIMRYTRVQQAVDGVPVEVIEDGRLITANIAARKLGAAEIFEQLRLAGYRNLAQIRSAYVEPSGQVSVFEAAKPGVGLPIAPPPSIAGSAIVHAGGGDGVTLCCADCGAMQEDGRPDCRCCGGRLWVRAEPAPARYA